MHEMLDFGPVAFKKGKKKSHKGGKKKGKK